MYSSAGILPFAVVDGKAYFLLGCETSDGSWSDFGGKKEPDDNDESSETACREFFEETLGVVTTLTEIRDRLDSNSVCVNSVTYSGQTYVMYVVQIAWSPQHTMCFTKVHSFLQRMHNQNYRKYLEKKLIRWFSAEEIFSSRPNVRLRGVFQDTIKMNSSSIHKALKVVS